MDWIHIIRHRGAQQLPSIITITNRKCCSPIANFTRRPWSHWRLKRTIAMAQWIRAIGGRLTHKSRAQILDHQTITAAAAWTTILSPSTTMGLLPNTNSHCNNTATTSKESHIPTMAVPSIIKATNQITFQSKKFRPKYQGKSICRKTWWKSISSLW